MQRGTLYNWILKFLKRKNETYKWVELTEWMRKIELFV